MLTGNDIIYFGPGDWDGLWRNRHQLMSRFAKFNKVMYVERVSSLRKLVRKREQYWPKLKNGLTNGPTRAISKNLYVYNASIIPIIGRYPFDNITWGAWRMQFKRTLHRLGFSKPIIWLSSPEMIPFLGQFDEKLSIYHVVDEYTEYRGADKAKLREMENQVLKYVDLVIVVSDKLFESKRRYHPHTHKIANGVDFSAYDNAIKSWSHAPHDISHIRRPILGYSGLISYRLDFDLIMHIAKTHPQWSIAMIGTVDEIGCENQIKQLKQMPNIHFLGMKPIEQVPQYILSFDACLIPYGQNGEVENLSPLKLYDFMAAGKPIVATDFPAAREFKDIVYLADTPDQFTAAIERALAETDKSLFRARRHAARQNTWECRIAQISDLIEPLIRQN